jgi:hypothetical protein
LPINVQQMLRACGRSRCSAKSNIHCLLVSTMSGTDK